MAGGNERFGHRDSDWRDPEKQNAARRLAKLHHQSSGGRGYEPC
jgi:hypothetical protein